MVTKGERVVEIIKYGTSTIKTIFNGVVKISADAIKSVFNMGYWINDTFWDDYDGWKNV